MDALKNFIGQTGFLSFFEGDNWKSLVMIAIACLLLYLAIVKKFEPLLLLPIAFGMLLTLSLIHILWNRLLCFYNQMMKNDEKNIILVSHDGT